MRLRKRPKEKALLGVWEGDVYTNETLGLSVSLPEGWTALTEAEIARLIDAKPGRTREEMLAEIEAGDLVTDLVIHHPSGTSAFIFLEKVDLGGLTEEAYAMQEATKTADYAASQGHVVSDCSVVTFAGQEYITYTVSGVFSEGYMHLKLYVKVVDSYVFTIRTVIFDGTDAKFEDFAPYFTKAK